MGDIGKVAGTWLCLLGAMDHSFTDLYCSREDGQEASNDQNSEPQLQTHCKLKVVILASVGDRAGRGEAAGTLWNLNRYSGKQVGGI